MFKKLFTAAWLALLFTFGQLAAAATNVSVTATPSNPTAPATVTLAVSGDSDGNPIMVTRVEYFNGTTSLGVSVQSPFTLTLNDLAAGTYQISAKVTTTDSANPVLQSAPLSVTIGTAPGAATAYFIHTDQLNTPRMITDGSGNLVWQWDSDPFGKDVANAKPAGQPGFTFNQRFPGQQFDRENNLHYNYFRDYDPALGRYIQSDPIGLKGGINTFSYVSSNPLIKSDPEGLLEQCSAGISTIGGYQAGPARHDYHCWTDENGNRTCRGFSFDPNSGAGLKDKIFGPTKGVVIKDGENTNDAKESSCQADDKNKCMDECASKEWDRIGKSPPAYGLINGVTCQGVRRNVNSICWAKCGVRPTSSETSEYSPPI